jgi:hypothetical protein
MGTVENIMEQLKKERDRVERQLSGLNAALSAFAGVYSGAKPKGTMSVATRKRIAAAQRARWAKRNADSRPVTSKRTISAASRRKMAAAQRARWAKIRAKGA